MHEHYQIPPQCDANHIALSPLSFLARAADVHAGDVAIAYGDIRRDWAETARRVKAVASGLAAMGIGRGDTVCMLAPNIPELFEAHFAVPMAGAVLCAINIRLEPDTIAYILAHSDCRLVIVDTALRPLLDAAFALMQDQLPVVEITDPAGPESEGRGDPSYEALAESAAGDALAPPEDEWQAITLNYTSGTSGRPKGVIYHHRGAYLMALGTVAAWQVPHRPSYLSVVPMFHCNGWGHPWMMAIVGGKTVFVRQPEPVAPFCGD